MFITGIMLLVIVSTVSQAKSIGKKNSLQSKNDNQLYIRLNKLKIEVNAKCTR